MNTSSPAAQLSQAFAPLYSYQLPPWWQTPSGIAILAGTLIAVALLIGLFVWYRWFYRPPLTLEQWRARELEALKVLLSRQPINYKRFFGAATFFKQYLVRVYGWKVLDKTDDELWDFIATRPEIPVKLHHPIKELLSYAQIVKFADAQALAEKADEAQTYLEMITEGLGIR